MRRERLEQWLADQNRRPFTWLAAFAALLAIQISPWWYPTPDAAAYLSIARGIAVDHQLRNLGGIHLGYPPGYPLLISPAFLISSRPFAFLSIIHWLAAMVFMCGVYRWTRRIAPAAAILLTGLVMVNTALWIYYRRTLSEMAFMAVMIWVVVLFNSALTASERSTRATRLAAGIALLILLVTIRETGALFIAGFALAAALQVHDRKLRPARALWMSAAVASPALAAVVLFLAYDAATARAAPSAVIGTHLSGFLNAGTPLPARVLEGTRLRVSEAGRLVVPGMFKAYAAARQWLHIDTVIYLAVFVVIAVGWWRLIRRRRDVLAATAPFYFTLYAVWAFDADTRYLLPMLPLLMLCLWFVVKPFEKWRLQALAVLFAAHLAVALGYWITVEIPRGRECNRQWAVAETLARGLDRGSGLIVASHQVPQCTRLMLSFLIDRPVPERARPGQYPGARTILELSADPDPAGFTVRAAAGPYKLLAADGPAFH